MKIKKLSEISATPPFFYSTGVGGLDKSLGGGLAKGSASLMAGMPGAGKSTLLLQVCEHIANNLGKTVIYLAGEESGKQIKMRAERMGINSVNILITEHPEVESVLTIVNKFNPDMLVIDSLQMMYSDKSKSAPGTPTQMKNALLSVTRTSKKKDITVIFIGHATKGGYIAGLQTLQHMVDTVMFLRKNEDESRTLQVYKNRFGEIAHNWDVEMTATGLKDRTIEHKIGEVKNINMTAEQFNKLTEGHPFWRPMVKASLEWLYLQQEQRKR